MKIEFSFRELVLMLMVSLPTTVYANEYIVSKVESLIAWGYWAVLRGAYRDWETDRKSTRLNSSHSAKSRMPSSA